MYYIAIQHDLVCIGSFEKPRTKTFYARCHREVTKNISKKSMYGPVLSNQFMQ